MSIGQEFKQLFSDALSDCKREFSDEEDAFLCAITKTMDWFDNSFAADVYTSYPDGRGGEVPAIYFESDGKYYRALIIDENSIKIDEISPRFFYEERKRVLGR